MQRRRDRRYLPSFHHSWRPDNVWPIRRSVVMVLLVIVAGSCARPPSGGDVTGDIRSFSYQNRQNPGGGSYRSSIRDRRGRKRNRVFRYALAHTAACRSAYRDWLAHHPQPISDQDAFFRTGQCVENPKKGFVGVAISGGGNKSAVYSAEVLFELRRYGLADDIDVVSGVSGGSFTAAIYALSCDPAE